MLIAQLKKLNPDGVCSFALIGAAATVSLTGLMILPILVGAYVDYLGHSESTAGWVSSANLAGIALMTLIVSLKTRHWSLQTVALYGLSVMIAADLLTTFLRPVPLFAGLRFLSGLGSGGCSCRDCALIPPR